MPPSVRRQFPDTAARFVRFVLNAAVFALISTVAEAARDPSAAEVAVNVAVPAATELYTISVADSETTLTRFSGETLHVTPWPAPAPETAATRLLSDSPTYDTPAGRLIATPGAAGAAAPGSGNRLGAIAAASRSEAVLFDIFTDMPPFMDIFH
jgi:hypothetical protein